MLKNMKQTEDVGIIFEILSFKAKNKIWELNNERFVVPAKLEKDLKFVFSTNSCSLILKFEDKRVTICRNDVDSGGKVVTTDILQSTEWKYIRNKVKENVELNFIFG
jgi:hypothetical protein